VLGFGGAQKVGAFLAVVPFPLGEQFAAIAVAQLGDKAVGGAFDGAISKGIHGNADRQLGKRIALRGAGQNRPLAFKPIEVAEKHKYEQASGAQRNGEMGAGKAHQGSLADEGCDGKVTSDI
jgi:hypothetical protein